MEAPNRLSPWWKHSVILTLVNGFSILIWLAAKSYRDELSSAIIPCARSQGQAYGKSRDVRSCQDDSIPCQLAADRSSPGVGCLQVHQTQLAVEIGSRRRESLPPQAAGFVSGAQGESCTCP